MKKFAVLAVVAAAAGLLTLFGFAHPAQAQVLDAEQVIDSPYDGWVYADQQYGPLKASSTPHFADGASVGTSFNLLGTLITDVSAWFNGLFDTQLAAKDTGDLAEGSNLYFTNARARAAISVADTSTIDLAYSTGEVTADIIAGSIGDTQLAFDTGQNLTTLSTPAFAGLTLSSPLAASSGGTGLTTFGGTNTILYTTAADTLASSASLTYNGTTVGAPTYFNVAAGGGYQDNGITILSSSFTNRSVTLGQNAGASLLSDGIRNTFLGQFVGRYATSSDFNTCVGYLTCQGASSIGISGNGNTAIGYNSLPVLSSGQFNVGVGYNALLLLTTGNYNFAMGPEALGSLTTGARNIAVGRRAGHVSTGSNNTFFGYQAGDNLTSGDKNIIIGYAVDAPSATGSNQLNIGNIIFGTGVSGIDATIAGSIGIGTSSPATTLDVNGIIKTQERSSATCNALAEGGIYYDSDDSHFYGCNGTTWLQLDN